MIKGLVFDIQRFSVGDGPGIRTTVFFQGCPLSCWWCHNPESRATEPRRSVRQYSLDGKSFVREEVTGAELTVDEVLQEVVRDRIFYEESVGGITLSGGEPLYQPDFCEALLEALKKNGFHTTLDTSGYAPAEVIARMIPFTDLFLFDLKLMDDEAHQKYSGVSNRAILENLRWLLVSDKPVIVRFPVIPGITDTIKNIDMMMTFMAESQSARQADKLTGRQPGREVHLLPYHAMAKYKYHRFKAEDRMPEGLEVTREHLEKIGQIFEQSGFRVVISSII